MNPALRANLRRQWIECLHEFASPKVQQCWIKGHPEIAVSFVELMCCYFDDLNLVDGSQTAVQEGWLSLEEAETIAEFHRLADAYQPPAGFSDYDHEAILQDPSWGDVVHAAREAWCGLRTFTTDPSESAEMDNLEKHWGKIVGSPG